MRLKYLLGSIIILGFVIRLWGIGFGLPGTFFPDDEQLIVNKAIAMGSGDLNPYSFAYPTLQMYLTALLYGMLFIIGRLLGILSSVQDYQYLYFTNQTIFYLANRIFSGVIFGTATIWMTWKLGKEIYDKRTGIISALLLSLCYIHVRESHFGGVNIPLTFWSMTCLLFLCRIVGNQKNIWFNYIAAGLAIGIATSTKYTGIYLTIPFIFAHFLRPGIFKKEHFAEHKKLVTASIFAGTMFFAASPFILLDFKTFLFYWQMQTKNVFLNSFISGTADSFNYYILSMLRHGLGIPFISAAGIGLILSCFARNSKRLILLIFTAGYFVLFISKSVTVLRYIDPLLPIFCLFAANVLSVIIDKSGNYNRLLRYSIPAILISAVSAPSVYNIFVENRLLCRKDTRTTASDWINSNIPSGTKIAMYGNIYYYPPLLESRELMEEKHRFITTLGAIRKGNFSDIFAGPRRYEAKLSMPAFPPVPNYYIYDIDSFKTTEIPKTWMFAPGIKISELKNRGVRYAIITECPVMPSSSDFEKSIIFSDAKLIAEFIPFSTHGEKEPPLYEMAIPTGFMVPISGHKLINNIGPQIRIYKLG